jgi:hypothetical protein
MFARELIKRDQPLPIGSQALNRLWGELVLAWHELVPQYLAGGLALGIRHGTQ